ncbi:conserved hypothetical protein [Deferribacter desulfuricans SSM1]|uniref:Type IV pilus assembly protein PilY1 n=2 Tax=Deferribacter TaxID=53572 RepID=D3PCL5_DEFDS|nr:conserved hypothetical protein [Deferribacter desulfuricans SSM1]
MRIDMRKYTIISLIIILMCFFNPLLSQAAKPSNNSDAGQMVTYCSIPPFVSSAIQPNVLIILDNSGSMFEFVYKDNTSTRSYSNDCSNDATVYLGYKDNETYFGLFDPNKKYSYDDDNDYFQEKEDGEWSGNFLNWLTTRRIDAVKKVLTGGKYIIEDGNILLTATDNFDRDFRKILENNVLDLTGLNNGYTDNNKGAYFYFYNDNNFVYFDVRPATWNNNCWLIDNNPTTFRVALKVETQPTGIIQKTWDKVRYGLFTFNHDDGGHLVSDIGSKYDNSTFILDINNITPSTWTPLGETLYEATLYFKGDKTYYNGTFTYDSPIQYSCQQNYVLILTDGESTMDKNFPSKLDSNDPNSTIDNLLDIIEGNEGFTDNELHNDLNDSNGSYSLAAVSYWTHTTDLREDLTGTQKLNIFTIFAFDDSENAKDLLKLSAKYGSFADNNFNNLPDNSNEWDTNNDNIPDNYFEANNATDLETSLSTTIARILQGAAAGSGVALMTDRTSSTSIAIQGLFENKKDIDNTTLTWIGRLFGWWVYAIEKDNETIKVNIREDTINNKKFKLTEDKILTYDYDVLDNKLVLKLITCDDDGSGLIDNSSCETFYSFDDITPIWDASEELLNREADNRKIYTYDDSGNLTQIDNFTNQQLFDTDNVSSLIDYIKGKDFDNYRNRTIKVDNEQKVWKLGDIIHSRPMLVKYEDYTVAYVGANDGMLHAFKVGYAKKLRDDPEGYLAVLQNSKNDSGQNEIGKELWGFIPRSVIPYLKFLADPNYCHLYYVDAQPYIIEEDGKKILIGGLRLGGGCYCSKQEAADECVKSPDNENGLSSYFALDITDPVNPKFLWEFNHKDLGFSYSGPAYIKRPEGNYIMFSSGPTTYDGHSSKSLKFFVLKLKNDFTLEKSTPDVLDGKTQNAFGGKLYTTGIDKNEDGFTDFVVTGIVKNVGKTNSQGGLVVIHTKGGDPSAWTVYQNYYNFSQNPTVSKIETGKCFNLGYYLFFGSGRYFYPGDDEGTSGVGNEENYIYGIPFDCDVEEGCKGTVNNIKSVELLDDPCNDLTNFEITNNESKELGWKIKLDPTDNVYLKERNIIDPVLVKNKNNPANRYTNNRDYWTSQIITFITNKYEKDPCILKGKSKIWALNCATGGPLRPDNITHKICSNYQVTDDFAIFTTSSQGEISIVTDDDVGNERYIEVDKNVIASDLGEDLTGNNRKGRILLWIEK